MVKAVLEFDLSNPDDKHEFEQMQKASAFWCIFFELDKHICLKRDDDLTDDKLEVFNEIHTLLHDLINEHDINY